MSETKINSKMIEAGELTSTQININDTNTVISEDGSGNLQFTDAVSGTKTLAQLAEGAVTAVNSETGNVVLDADDISDAATTNKFTSQADIDRLANTSGTNTGDQDLSGLITGAVSSTDNAIARFDGTTGKLIQNSGVTIDDSGNVATSGTIDGRDVSADGAKLDGIESGAEVNDVNSVFGRTGAVSAQTNDYTWAQVDKTTSDIADLTTKSHSSLTDIGTNSHTQIDSHISSTANPHAVNMDDVTPTTTKGDIIVENGTNAVRVGVGTDGQVLTADSSETTGIKWADASGGASVLDLVGYQEGGWSAYNNSSFVQGWGILSSLNIVDNSSSLIRNDDGIALQQVSSNGVAAYISQGQSLIYANSNPTFSFKFAKNSTTTDFKLFLGLTTQAGPNHPTTNYIGLIVNSSGQVYFTNDDDGTTTETYTGLILNNTNTYIFTCEVVGTTSVKYALYDRDYTEIASATHTTNIRNLLYYLLSRYEMLSGLSGLLQYSSKLIMK